MKKRLRKMREVSKVIASKALIISGITMLTSIVYIIGYKAGSGDVAKQVTNFLDYCSENNI